MTMLPLKLLAPQHLGRGKACRAAADDDDLAGASPGLCRAALPPLAFLANEDPAVALLDRPAVRTELKAGARTASPVRKSKQA